MNTKQEIKYEIVNSDVLKIFVIVFSFFTLLGCIRLYYMFNGQTIGDVIQNIYPYLAVTNNTMHNLTRPWVLFTHMGSEVSVMGMLSNFLWLYMFGFIIQDLKGKSSVWPLFVFAGVVSAIVVCIAVAVKSSTLQSGFYYGMRPSIVAIAVAAVAFRPTYKVFQMLNGGFSLWILGVIFLLLSLSMGQLDIANILAILTAALVGYLYNNLLENFFENIQYKLNNRATEALTRKKSKIITPKYNSNMVVTQASKVVDISQQKMDALLDKISNGGGMDALTDVEKQWLKDYSNKNKIE